MVFIATQQQNFEEWDYIFGSAKQGLSIAIDRFYHLQEMNSEESIKISLRDPATNNWTKWVPYPGLLWGVEKNKMGYPSSSGLTAAVDVHRSILSNEIVIESDYPTYEENYESAKIIGRILEEKGFQPLYYYSGNKSVHVHVFFDWDCLKKLDDLVQDQLRMMFKNSKLRFKRKFIEWLRTKMINCWDTQLKQFDKDLIKASHLIRCELSKNKRGYKTFIGYTYKDMSFVPYICNEDNRIYPKLGEFRLSQPKDIEGLVEEFIEDVRIKTKVEKSQKRNKTLFNFGLKDSPEEIRGCVKEILSADFKNIGDGFQRGMFILLNELREVLGDSQAKIIIHDWNSRMDFPVKDQEIEYRFKTKNYSLGCKYIHDFLRELNIDVSKKCKGKVYK